MTHRFWFVPWIGWLLFLLFALPCQAEPANSPTVYHHGAVFTGRSDRVDASWFVVGDGRFLDAGVGSVPERWSQARMIDLTGRFVAPGFVDAHVHLLDGGLSLLQVDAGDARDASDIKAAVTRAAGHSLGAWVVVRNVGLDVLGGRVPTHETMRDLVAPASGRPVLMLLKGGHHVYASPAALERLGIDGRARSPKGGIVVCDEQGAPTGLLVDQAAWDAIRALDLDLPPETIAQAVLRAQDLAIRFGITTVGDNTFFPTLGAQYARMADKHLLRLRISMRSFGPEPMTRLAMKSLGVRTFGRPGLQIRYFGEKYFLDSSLSTAGAAVSGAERTDTGPRYSVGELRDQMLFAGPFGTAFHAQSRKGAERLAEARTTISRRRAGSLPDVLDHCGQCGGGDLPQRLRASGLRLTLLPGQLHDLPALLRDLPADSHASLLQIRELFDAGIEPALTSDWPFGAEKSYPDLPDGFHRLGLSALANVAVAVSGKAPDGEAIEGVSTRTIPLGQALLGITAYGAQAIGRDDVGRMVPDARADFVVLPKSPFKVDPVELYRMDALATYIDGAPVGAAVPGDVASPVRVEMDVKDFSRTPSGQVLSPIFGYDPVPGFLLGAAYFFYPYQPRGLHGLVQAYVSPQQMRAYGETEVVAGGLWGRLSPRLWVRANSLADRYYGAGMATTPDVYVKTEPLRLDGAVGLVYALDKTTSISLHARGGHIRDNKARDIETLGPASEGRVDGTFAGGRVEISHDNRDNAFSTRSGGREALWAEVYGLQAGAASFRSLAGLTLTRFVALRAPDFILALRADGGASAGDRSYATDYAIGGSDLLRGYYSNRFRGQHFAVGTAELRWPMFGPISGAAFGDVGRVWAAGDVNPRVVAYSGGAGVRIGLPPDRMIRLRFDVGFAPDQWGIFFKFNEAF
jgi:predicted amidohydrolase YtcJ